jgi:hypothetical protein
VSIVEGSHDYKTQAAEAKKSIQKPYASITQSLLIDRPWQHEQQKTKETKRENSRQLDREPGSGRTARGGEEEEIATRI